MPALTAALRQPLAVAALLMLAVPAQADHVDGAEIRWACGFGGGGGHGHPSDCGIDPVGGGDAVDGHPAEWGTDDWIRDDDRILGVEIDGDARAIPIIMGDRHEVFNVEIGGTPVAITYCPLCGSGITFLRVVDGEIRDFTASGFLYRNDLVMWDPQTGTLWNQITGTPIGTLVDERIQSDHADIELDWVATTVSTWSGWKADHPDSLLLQPVFSPSSYHGAYAGYDTDCRHGLSSGSCDVQGLHPKEQVVAAETTGGGIAFPLYAVQQNGGAAFFEDADGTGFVATVRPDGGAAIHDADGHRFSRDEAGIWTDEAGRRWDLAQATSPDGERLEPVQSAILFWFAWEDHHRDTTVWLPDSGGALPLEERGIPAPSVVILTAALFAIMVAGRRE